jgi:tRNA A-37 threonylcarbamoyl transferase component Bud32
MPVELTAADYLNLPGEIVSGHPDRHVLRVELNDRVCYLKRQHRITWRERWRNWRAGFGWVSRCEREARLLAELATRGFAPPKCVAFGEHGGRAFLLVEEHVGDELRVTLRNNALALTQCERLGEAIGMLHAAGFTTPDLTAKHIFSATSHVPTLIDWQSAERRVPSPTERVHSLAALHASVADATPQQRLRFLRGYQATAPKYKLSIPEIVAAAEKQATRRSIRDQRQQTVISQRLVWLAGEAVCVVPEIATTWPTPTITPPFYGTPFVEQSRIILADGRQATLIRDRESRLRRGLPRLRGRRWRSSGVTHGRVLFHLQRYGIPGPRLLAFGQQDSTGESFTLFEPTNEAGLPGTVFLQVLHDAGCRLASLDGLHVGLEGKVRVTDPRAIRLQRNVTVRQRTADLDRLQQLMR